MAFMKASSEEKAKDHPDKPDAFWKPVLKTEIFGHNEQKYIWQTMQTIFFFTFQRQKEELINFNMFWKSESKHNSVCKTNSEHY